MDRKQYIINRLEDHFTSDHCVSLTSILLEDVGGILSMKTMEVDKLIDQIISGSPIQYVTGVAPFYGYFFEVDHNVLIPRPETEELVYSVEKYIKRNGLETPRILDIGTGSGCIPITLNKLFPNADVCGIDVSSKALKVARANNTKIGASVDFYEIDFTDETRWDSLGDFQIVISNPPYIPHEEKKLMSPTVLDYEPHLALFVENEDPLLLYRKIAQFAQKLETKTAVFLECNEFNANEVEALFKPIFDTEIIKDLQGKDRIVTAISNTQE